MKRTSVMQDFESVVKSQPSRRLAKGTGLVASWGGSERLATASARRGTLAAHLTALEARSKRQGYLYYLREAGSD